MERSLSTNLIIAISLAFTLYTAQPAVGQTSGGLTFLEIIATAEQAPTGIAVSPDGLHAYVVTRTDTLEVFELSPLNSIQLLEDGVGGVDGLRDPEAVVVSPDGTNVYVASRGDDAVAMFFRGSPSGLLTFGEVQKDGVGGVDGLEGAASLTVSPDGSHVYVAGRQDHAIAVFERSLPGFLTFVEAEFDDTAGVDGIRGTRAVAITPDGNHVYASGPAEKAVAAFLRNASTGELDFVQVQREGFGGVVGIDDVRSIVVSPDNGHVYTADVDGNRVAVFARNAATGALAQVQVVRDGRDGVEGLNGPEALAVSPDGANLYAAGAGDSAVAVFSRDSASGRLRFVERLVDGVEGVTGLRVVRSLAPHPSGTFLFAADYSLDTITTLVQDDCPSGVVTGDEQCDDGNGIGGDGCSSICTLELCGGVPTPGCRKPASGAGISLIIKDNQANATRDRLIWKWGRGAATTVADFGDPLTSASYLLCVYDDSAEPQPRIALAAPAGGTCFEDPCWKTAGTRGFSYRDRDKALTPDGLTNVILRRGDAGRARVIVKGKGPKTGADAIPLTPQVTVQLHNTDTGVCWDAEYSVPTENSSTLFKAVAD